ISEELRAFFSDIDMALKSHRHLLGGKINDIDRKIITDALGQAGSKYRERVYENGFSGKKEEVNIKQLTDFTVTAVQHIEHTIEANRRPDHLYQAYNLLTISHNSIALSPLGEMLEGQVAALSSGYPDSEEALRLLDTLRKSALYSPKQESYLLYPNRELPRFLEKNSIPNELLRKSILLQQLVSDNNRQIVVCDAEGGCHFNGEFRFAGDLEAALNSLQNTHYGQLVESEKGLVMNIFEEVFNHKAFTGRSGTFFAYEGLGSVYWHMVSKLHLAVQEVCLIAYNENCDKETISRLTAHYYEIGKGIGIHKSPAQYGAFPTDPYSHTPHHRGAQQPGMTGQVKEDILIRFTELGVVIDDGRLSLKPFLLDKNEFLPEPGHITFIDIHGNEQKITLEPGSLCFSYCQVPVVCTFSDGNSIEMHYTDGSTEKFPSTSLTPAASNAIFRRTGEVSLVQVYIDRENMKVNEYPPEHVKTVLS
ncbi:MAG: hypothetical protein IH591_09840, partial [Bacteroidales bacterium]|nr:hypothetical protein [Bacteroidales bacterium]